MKTRSSNPVVYKRIPTLMPGTDLHRTPRKTKTTELPLFIQLRSTPVLVILLMIISVLFNNVVFAADCSPWVARAISIQGLAEKRITTDDRQIWQAITSGHSFCASDVLRVRANSRVALRLNNDTVVRLDEHTTISFTNLNPAAPSAMNLEEGIAHFISRVKRAFKVITPFVNAAIEGTEFVVAVDKTQTAVTVFEGKVRTSNEYGQLLLTKGQTAIAGKDEAPVLKLLLNPRNAVQWALHYPVVTDTVDAEVTGTTTKNGSTLAQAFKQSLIQLGEGNSHGALEAISRIPVPDLTPATSTYRAALWLSAGRVNKALEDSNHALKTDPQNSSALALQSVIALSQNQPLQASNLAQQAIDSNPENTAGYLALSMAKQAQFDLAGAQLVLAAAPKSARVLSRHAELSLMTGDPDQALSLARQALTINPLLSHSHSILGFVLLIDHNIETARQSFNRARDLDQTSPLPRLGLGLVAIRLGDIKTGRGEIEFAASLDPNNALIRSYLGKAYYEENRSKLANDQFDMARALDPLDPTPWYYSAINLQSENRPVEALNDIRKATALNDNRAVFRSRQQLDDDSAARNASVARIYRDLGFDQLAMKQAWQALDDNPASHSAHRFLSDAYANLPRHEIARLSELLQSQLLQPLNSNPIQPRLAESNLGILEGSGPADASPVELNPLFTRNGLRYQVDSLLGGQNTRGGDILLSGIQNNMSFSFGQYHYSSDGFRDNNDQEQNISAAFVQLQLNTSLAVQAEYRKQQGEIGDLQLNLGPDNFDPGWRQNSESTTKRFGLHYRPSKGHNVLYSYMRPAKFTTTDAPVIDIYTSRDINDTSHELQYQYRQSRSSLISGAVLSDNKYNELFRSSAGPLPALNLDSKNKRLYLYYSQNIQPDITLTTGFSGASLKSENLNVDLFSPKLGASWQINQNTTIRAAAFSMLHRPFSSRQTIEPTHVAGFNQFFDEFNGTKSRRYATAIDHKFNAQLSGGIEISRRTLESPLVNSTTGETKYYAGAEQLHRAWLYQTLNNQWALTGEYHYERKTNEPGLSLHYSKVHYIPLGIQYASNTGLRAGLTGTYYNHDTEYFLDAGKDNFWIFDISAGWRLTKRRGIATFGIKNLFDESFSWYNLDTGGSPKSSLFQPKRSVFVALTLAF